MKYKKKLKSKSRKNSYDSDTESAYNRKINKASPGGS